MPDETTEPAVRCACGWTGGPDWLMARAHVQWSVVHDATKAHIIYKSPSFAAQAEAERRDRAVGEAACGVCGEPGSMRLTGEHVCDGCWAEFRAWREARLAAASDPDLRCVACGHPRRNHGLDGECHDRVRPVARVDGEGTVTADSIRCSCRRFQGSAR